MRLVPYLRKCSSPARLWPEADTLFSSFFRDFPFTGWPREGENWLPSVDILEKDGNLILKASLAGVEEKDIHLELDGSILTIKAERKLEDEDKRESYHRIESYHGSFSRSFTLPETVDRDKIKADYKNGVLTVKIPMKPESKARVIPVASN